MFSRCASGRKMTGRTVQVMRVPAWFTATEQGSARSRARLVSMRPSYSHCHACSDAAASSAGLMVRSATAIHWSACAAEYASQEAWSAGRWSLSRF